MNCVNLTRKLKTLYESGESQITRDIERLYMAIDDDELNGVAEIEDLDTEFARAEKWIRKSKKILKGEKPEEIAYFMEQRFDGLDNAVIAFIRNAKKGLSPKAEYARKTIGMSLNDISILECACPSKYDTGISSTKTVENLVSQSIPLYYLHLYLSSLLTEESIDFYMEVKVLEELYKKNPTAKNVVDKARFIANAFVSDGCNNDINLSEPVKKRIMASFDKTPFSIEPFTSAAAEVAHNMSVSNTIDSFKHTQYYDKLIRRLTPRPYSFVHEKTLEKHAMLLPLSSSGDSDIGEKDKSSATTSTSTMSVAATATTLTMCDREDNTEARTKKGHSFRKTLHSGTSHTFMSLRSKEFPNGKLITIHDVLQNKALYKDFKKFLQENGCSKPLSFIREAVKFPSRHFASPDDARETAAKIFESYLIGTDNERGVGVSIEMQQRLYTTIYEKEDEPIKSSIFKGAYNEVVEAMRLTIFVQYVISERWLSVTWTPDDTLPNHKLTTALRHRRGTVTESAAPLEPAATNLTLSDLAGAASTLSPLTPQKPSPQVTSHRPASKHQKERRNTLSEPASRSSRTVSPPPPDYTPHQVTASELFRSLQSGNKSKEKSPRSQSKGRSLSRKSSLNAIPHVASPAHPVHPVPTQIKSPEYVTISGSQSNDIDTDTSGVVLPSPLLTVSPMALEAIYKSDQMPVSITISMSESDSAASRSEDNAFLETPRSADARKGLLKNYRDNVLPKLEKLTADLSKLIGLDELSEQRNNVRLVQDISRCLSDVTIPLNVSKPNFTVVHPNAKFVQFRRKLLYCAWEVNKKASIIVQNLTLNCPCDINTTMSGTITKYRDIYHSIILAFSVV